MGYRPILSSAEGFHDSSPTLSPWESCLEVLHTCPLMVLVIDNKYGSPLEWPNFANEIKGKSVSPTHAEYLFAHFHRKRLLVFIRENILTHYQTYRTALKRHKGNKGKTLKALREVIP